MIEITNLYKQYVKEYYTLYNINIIFNANTFILGDDNSGIDCLFRILSKIEKNFDGQILIDGQNIKQIKDKNLQISYIPKEPYLFNTTIEKNLYYPLKIRKINKKIAKNIINDAISNYNLNNFENKIKKLNYSQKKIITLIRAIIHKPKYILIENFFKDLDKEYFDLANKIISDAKKDSIIILGEETPEFENYKDFKTIKLNNGSICKDEKKE